MTHYLCEYLRDLIKKREDLVQDCNNAFDSMVEPMRRVVKSHDAENEIRAKIESLKNEIQERYNQEGKP